MDFILKDALKTAQQTGRITESDVGQANIKVLGVGGGGSNMVSWLYKKGIRGAEVFAINTDKQHLDITDADGKVLLGQDLTRGLGAGGYPKVGMEAAKESISELKEIVRNLGENIYALIRQ